MADKGFKRKLAAILSADVEGYSRLMDDDEEATVRTIKIYRATINDLVQQYRGRIVDTPGDNILAEYSSVVDAVNCAVEVQRELAERNVELPNNRKMEFRIGVNLGDVIEDDGNIYGDGVNIAARVESLAEAGGICISGRAYDQVANKLGLEYENLGEHHVKNITRPIRVYRVLSFPGAAAHRVVQAKTAMKRKWRNAALIIAAVLVVGGGALAIWNFYFRPLPIESASLERMAFQLPEKPSIAVLAFENLSADPKQEYLSDGISEAIISALSKVPEMFVIARNSSFTYKGKPVKVQQVAEELGVRYVLEGSVQRSVENLRVTAQLIDAVNGHHLWSERYDRKIDDLMAVQDEIAMNVLTMAQVELTDGEQALIRKRETNNFKALEKHNEALMYVKRFTRDDIFKGRQLSEEAIRLDPNYPGGYRMVGWCHLLEVWMGWSQNPGKSLQFATEYAQKALTLDENNSETLALWGNIHMFKGEIEKAIEICRRAVDINPNMADATAQLGLALHLASRYEEAVSMLEKASRLNPFPPTWYFNGLSLAYYCTGRYEEAIVACKKALDIQPRNVGAYEQLSAIYVTLGQEEKARAAATELIRLNPKFSVEHRFKSSPWKNGEVKQRYYDALLKAGLPE